jgi:hypothetical protein
VVGSPGAVLPRLDRCVSEAVGRWQPAEGERVVLVRTGQTGTVVRLAPTEWGLLCDIQFDRTSGAGLAGPRRVHASTELQPLAEGAP